MASSVGVKLSELPPTECDSVHHERIESNYRKVDSGCDIRSGPVKGGASITSWKVLTVVKAFGDID